MSNTHSPMESFSQYRGDDWTPERVAFHQNLEMFAERVGLIVGLQSNGKVSQDNAYSEIRQLWKELKGSKGHLIDNKLGKNKGEQTD
ncbi:MULTISPECIES: hypothetical protein [Synechococcaceae]|uniref:DUF7219 family protein n=1 Tax=Synechococcaceae TaxID=1890426 RepID=UPI0021A6C062|nr:MULTISPECIES: hypothetical protein [Synechococcaceae]